MAAYFWVGGSGTWDNSTTTNWATSSGGAGGAGVPTSADTVTFDANSGTAATVTVAATAQCTICTVNKSDINISLGASVAMCQTVTNSYVAGTCSVFTLTAGTLSLNSYTLTVNCFSSSNANARTIAFGTGNITASGYAYPGSGVWDTQTSTNLTITGTSPTVNLSLNNVSQGITCACGGTSTVSFNITGNAYSTTFGNGVLGLLNNLNYGSSFTGSTNEANGLSVYGNLTLSSAMTATVFNNGTGVTFAGTGTQTFTSNGVTWKSPIIVNGATGAFGTADAITSTSTFTSSGSKVVSFTGGTVTFASVTLGTSSSLNLNSVGIVVTGSGACFSETVSRSSMSQFSTTAINATSTSPKTLSFFSGNAIPSIKQGGTGTMTITTSTGTGTVNLSNRDLLNSVQPTTILVTGGLTLSGIRSLPSGTSGNLVTIGSTNTTPVTFQAYNTGIITTTFCSLSYITGSNTSNLGYTGVAWRFFSSTNGGNNTNLTFPKTYYWVGGSGTWDGTTTTNWSLTSGGAGAQGPPTASDDVIFDTSSNATAYTVAMGINAVCFNMTMAGPTTGQVTWAGTTAMSIYGGMSLSGTAANGGINRTYSPAYPGIQFLATAAGNTITTNGVSLGNYNFQLLGVGGWILGSALTAGYLFHSAGTFDTAGYAVTTIQYSASGSNTRTLSLGATTWTATGAGGALWAVSGTNITLERGTSTINITGSAYNLYFGNLTYNNVVFNYDNQSNKIVSIVDTGTNTFNSLTFNPSSTTPSLNEFVLSGNITITSITVWNSGGTYNNRLFVHSDTTGTQRNINYTGGSTIAHCDFRDINATAGAIGSSGSTVGDCGGNTNVTGATPKTVYWNLAGTQNWSSTGWATSSGGSAALANFPLAQDTVIFNNAGSADTVTIDCAWNIGSVDMSARTSAMTLNIQNIVCVYGSWSNGSGTTLSGSSTLTFTNRAIKTITPAGKTFPFNVTIESPGGGVQLLANWSTGLSGSTFALYFKTGTIDFNNFTLSHTGTISSNLSYTRVLAFGTTGVLKWISTNGSNFNFSSFSNFSYTGTSAITFDMSGGFACGFWMSATTEAQSLNVTCTGSGNLTTNSFGAGEFKNLIFSSYTGTYSDGTYNTGIYGSLTLVSAMTLSLGGTWTFKSTSGTSTITSAGKTLPAVTFNGLGGTWQLQDALSVTNLISLTAGTLNFNSFNVTAATLNISGSSLRGISWNGSTLTLSGSGTAFDASTLSNLSTSGSATVSLTSSLSKTFAAGGGTFGIDLNNGGSGALTITGGNSFRSITNTVQPTSFVFTAGSITTLTTSTGFAVNGTAGNLVTIGSTTTSAFTLQRAISGTNTNAYCSISYCTGNTTATGGGAVVWQFSSTTNGGNNTNLTFISAIYYWVGGSGTWDSVTTTNWSLSSGGAGNTGPPSSGDQVRFDSASNSGNYTVTIATGASCQSAIIGAPASGKVTLAGSGDLSVSGGFDLTGGTAGITNSYTGNITFAGSGSFISNGVLFASNINVNAAGASVGLGSSLTTTGSFTLTQGTISLSTYSLTAATFNSSNSNTRTLAFGTGNITTTGSGTAFTTATVTGLTVTGTPVVNISYSGATATTVATGATTEANAISFNFTGGTYTLSFLNSLNDRCNSVNFTGFNGTWGSTNTCYIGGNLTLSSGMTLTASTGTCNFLTTSASVTRTITSNGKTLDFPISINYPSTSTLQLVDAMVIGVTRNLTLLQGTLNLNNFNLTTGTFTSNANTRAVAFGTGRIILTNGISGTTVLDMATATGFTSTGTGGFASAMDVNATFSLGSTAGSSTTAANLFLTGGSATATLTTGSYFKTIDFTGYSGGVNTTTLYLYGYVLSASGTFSGITARMIANGSITSNGNFIAAIDVGYGVAGSPGYTSTSISNTLLGTVGTAVTVTASGTGPVGAYTGNADDGYYPVTPGWNISFNNTNYTTMYVGSNFYVTFGSGSTNYSGLSASNPALPKIMMSAADRSMQRLYWQITGTTPNRTFWWRHEGGTGTSGTVGSPTMLYEGYLYENDPSTIDIVTGAMSTGGVTGVYSASALLLAAAGLGTATTGTRLTYSSGTTYPNSTTTIVDNLNVTGALTFSSGTLTTTSGNVTASQFVAITAIAKTLVMGSGTWTMTGSGPLVWNVTNPGNLTVTPGTSTISMTSSLAKTFVGAGKTWGILNQAGAGTLTITGSNTFSDITATGSGRPSTILFTAGTTSTFSNFTLSGTSGNLVTIGSDTGAAVYTLSKASGAVSSNYLNISYSTATGGATWYAGSSSTNGGNNTGWLFTNNPVFNASFFAFF